MAKSKAGKTPGKGQKPPAKKRHGKHHAAEKPRILMEPPRFALLGGVAGGTLALAWFLWRQSQGIPIAPPQVVVGTALTVVISYGTVGLFTWYLIKIGERELPAPDDTHAAHAPGRGAEGPPAAEAESKETS